MSSKRYVPIVIPRTRVQCLKWQAVIKSLSKGVQVNTKRNHICLYKKEAEGV